jgi:4-amino-4-deoxy-L-arabinose transferase-like glycosyltransferase
MGPDLGMAELTPTIQKPAAPVMSARRRWWAVARTSFFWMVVIAFALRFGTIVIGHTYKFRTSRDNFGFGWEMGRIGQALAEGHGFSDPFDVPTGPTAWEPPLYPLLIAGVFKLFGVYSHLSAFVLLVINSIFSALTCIPLFLIARRCFSEKVAVWTAWTWALLPYIIYWCTRWVWETSLSALLFAVLFWLALTMEEREGIKWWAVFGFLWGVAALNSPVLLSFLPISGLWAWYHRAKLGKKSLGGVVLASLIFFACLAPWLVRNYRTFHKPVFLRSNFGAELRMGNGPNADGTWQWYLHPTQNLNELHKYERMGEIAYVAERQHEALEWMKQNPARFVWFSFKKFVYYWAGVPKSSNIPPPEVKNALFLASSILCFWGLGRAIRKRRPGAWLFFLVLATFPFVYYIVFPHARYRHPIDPEIGILAIYVISEAEKKQGASVVA